MFMVKPRGFTRTVAGVTHEDKVPIRKPAYQACQQQSGNVCRRLMLRPVHAIPLRGVVQGYQDWERPGPSGERPLDEHRHDYLCMAPAIGGIAVRRPCPIAMPLPNTLGPGCSVAVLSPARSTGPGGATWSSRNVISTRASAQVDHRRWENTR